LDRTLAEQRTRTLNERFATAAEQLGSDKPAVQLAGVYAMAHLADDWPDNRQTCIDVLCGYLRMPYEPDPGQDAPRPEQLAFQAIREVRHTVIRVITAHLQQDTGEKSWQGLNFDFTGVVFDGGDFSDIRLSGGVVTFDRAVFADGMVIFVGAVFDGGMVSFDRAVFAGGRVAFDYADFDAGTVAFDSAAFSSDTVSFDYAAFSGGTVKFNFAAFAGGVVTFDHSAFSAGTVTFDHAAFSGGELDFDNALFSGGTVDFSKVHDWSFPPKFPWTDTPPAGVQIPTKRATSDP
jgi:hypothetical protein